MDLVAVRRVLDDIALKSAFQAFLLTATADGHTVREIAAQLGVPSSTLHRWLVKAREARSRDPRAELASRPSAARGPCVHTRAFYMGKRRICLECLANNFQAELDAQRDPATDPKPEPPPAVKSPAPTRKERRAAKHAAAAG